MGIKSITVSLQRKKNNDHKKEKKNAVFIGYPIWWWTAPMIIGTFPEHYDLTGYDVYPFPQIDGVFLLPEHLQERKVHYSSLFSESIVYFIN